MYRKMYCRRRIEGVKSADWCKGMPVLATSGRMRSLVFLVFVVFVVYTRLIQRLFVLDQSSLV